jgi:putative transposase
VYSRYVVGWLLAERESTALATRLIEESCEKQGVAPGSLVLHSDRGSAMTSQGTAQLLAQLGVLRSLSRPRVSTDNPFSEAHFKKTLKYHPGFPRRFGSLEDARAFCRRFFEWYHREHKHSALSRLSPEDVHYRRGREILARRDRVLEAAFERNSDRFVNGKPSSRPVEQEVWMMWHTTPSTLSSSKASIATL